MQSGLEILSWSFWSPETREPAEWRGGRSPSSAGTAVPDHAIPATASAQDEHAVEDGRPDGARSDAATPGPISSCSARSTASRAHARAARCDRRARRAITDELQSVRAQRERRTLHDRHGEPSSRHVAGGRAPARLLTAGSRRRRSSRRTRAERALLVGYDEALPSEYRPYVGQVQRSYALALLLGAAAAAASRSRRRRRTRGAGAAGPAVHGMGARAFRLRVTAGGQGWTWRRTLGRRRFSVGRTLSGQGCDVGYPVANNGRRPCLAASVDASVRAPKSGPGANRNVTRTNVRLALRRELS